MKEISKMTVEELHATIQACQKAIAEANEKKNREKLEIRLFSTNYEGPIKHLEARECWVARVDEHKKILEFVKPCTTFSDGHQKEKIFLLTDGDYLLHQKGSTWFLCNYQFELKQKENEIRYSGN